MVERWGLKGKGQFAPVGTGPSEGLEEFSSEVLSSSTADDQFVEFCGDDLIKPSCQHFPILNLSMDDRITNLLRLISPYAKIFTN